MDEDTEMAAQNEQQDLERIERDVVFLQNEIHEYMKTYGISNTTKVVNLGMCRAMSLIEADKKHKETVAGLRDFDKPHALRWSVDEQ